MACLNTLKEEIKILESVFPKNQERFQIHFATMDELNCKFICNSGKPYEINANITVSKIDLTPRYDKEVVRTRSLCETLRA